MTTHPTPASNDSQGTPRTDAVSRILSSLSIQTSEQFVLAEFARTLERELQTTQAHLSAAEELANALVSMVDLWKRQSHPRTIEFDSQVKKSRAALANWHALTASPSASSLNKSEGEERT